MIELMRGQINNNNGVRKAYYNSNRKGSDWTKALMD